MNNSSLYIRCEVLLIDEDSEEVFIIGIGVYQIPRTGEYLWFGDSLSPAPSAYIIQEVAHHVRPQLEHAPASQQVVLYVKPVNKKELT